MFSEVLAWLLVGLVCCMGMGCASAPEAAEGVSFTTDNTVKSEPSGPDDGTDLPPGYQGPAADGTDGTDGADGTDGTDGIDGTDGTDGTDGLDGTDSSASCSDEQQEALKEATLGVFETHCAGCHTVGSKNYVATKMGDITDLEQLVQRGFVLPGDPGASTPHARMEDGSMPPLKIETRPTEAEILTVAQWIECLEPTGNKGTDFITVEAYLEWIRNDLESGFQLNDQRLIRYFSLVHLYNSGATEEQLEYYRNAVNKLVNSLSWKTKIIAPVPVDSKGLILRIDLQDYGWDVPPQPDISVGADDKRTVWDRIEAVYPYAVEYDDQPDAEYIYAFSQSDTPIIQADWFAANAAIPPLYHSILGLPSSLSEMESLFGVDILSNIELGNVVRAGFGFSNVSVNNRVVERHELGLNNNESLLPSYYGALWVSYDFADNKGVKNIFQHPVDFVHDGNELIFSLPNGYQAYLITDANGKRIDKAPTAIVSDKLSAPPEVTNGLSCMSCHFEGMNPATDEIRDIVLEYQDQYPQDVIGDVVKLYPSQSQFADKLEIDKTRFENALTAAGLPIAKERAEEPISQLAYRFDDVMNLTRVATAVGLSEAKFSTMSGIDRLKSARAEIANLVDKGGVLKRELFDESYRDIVCFLNLGKPRTPGSDETGCAIVRLCNDKSGLQGDVTLRIGGMELQALEGKCSPCRAVPVAIDGEGQLSVVNVVQSVQDGQLVNEAVVEFSETVKVSFTDDNEFLLRVLPQLNDGKVTGVQLTQQEIEAPLTCDDVP